MFAGFTTTRITTSSIEIFLRYGGSGPPVLLLHGYPQTHVMWHLVAPQLTEYFTVVAPDLRGYGDSAKPVGDPEHLQYAKRTMAADQVEVMERLGFKRFAVVGHDRGARVGHRMALDYPERVSHFAALDIVPTHHMYTTFNREVATAYYHWFFLIQPFDVPEHLIGADPQYYLRRSLGGWGGGFSFFAPEALDEYERCFCDPATIHATCEDYRAAASIDLQHDDADRDRRIDCPMLVLWGADSVVGKHYAVVDVWRRYAEHVQGQALPGGHFLAEEQPDDVAQALRRFLRQG